MTEATRTARADLAKFAREGEAIHVKNTQPNIVVHVFNVEGHEDPVEFDASTSHSGDSVKELPATYLKQASFRKALSQGILEIVDADDPEVLDAAEAWSASWKAQQEAKEQADRFLEAQQPKSFSGVQCLAQEGRHQCPDFAIYAQNNRERPPLCSRHAYLAQQFTPEETGTFTNGKADVRWTRVTLLGR